MVQKYCKVLLVLAFLAPDFSSGHDDDDVAEEMNSRSEENMPCFKRGSLPDDPSGVCYSEKRNSFSPGHRGQLDNSKIKKKIQSRKKETSKNNSKKKKPVKKEPMKKKFRKKDPKGKKPKKKETKKKKPKKNEALKKKPQKKKPQKNKEHGKRRTKRQTRDHPHSHLYRRDGYGKLGWDSPMCNQGRMQSPVDIKTKNVVRVVKGPLKLTGFDDIPTLTRVWNCHGSYLKVNLNFRNTPTLSGGILDSGKTYNFLQYHFHWGNSGYEGSEHAIDGKKFALEAHFVFGDSSKDPKTLTANVKNTGIVVLTVVYELSHDNHTKLNFLTDILASNKILNPDTKVDGPNMKLRDFLPTDIRSYYTYLGSLTTPPCSEGTRFIIFAKRGMVAGRQVKNFHNIYGADDDPSTRTLNNWRPLQPLNGRKITLVTSN
uniref:Carbonic anhydrase n=1 Tax=Lygus hesperus TaxID=30085 RepID=A0A0A9XBA7_LYGHE